MFKRIIYEQWTSIVPIISFCLTFAVFAVMSIRALRLKRDAVRHMAAMPLQDEAPPMNGNSHA